MKNKILKSITGIAVLSFLIGGCAIDNNSIIPDAVCYISGIWILLFCYVNYDLI